MILTICGTIARNEWSLLTVNRLHRSIFLFLLLDEHMSSFPSYLALWLSGFLSFEEAQGQALHRAFASQIQGMQSREPGVEL